MPSLVDGIFFDLNNYVTLMLSQCKFNVTKYFFSNFTHKSRNYEE